MQTRTVVSDDELILASDADGTGQPGDMVFKTGGVERARITAAGVGSGWPALLGGSISAIGDITLTADSDANAAGDLVVYLGTQERLRITNGGDFKVTGPTGDPGNGINVEHDSTTTPALRLHQTSTGPIAKWRTGTTDVGFVQNSGALKILPSNDRAMSVEGVTWQAARAFGFSSKDGIFYISAFTDASGAADPTYTKLFGAANVSKTGAGNMDAFWASITHSGAGEVGLFIGDVTAAVAGSAGNIWGGHFLLKQDIATNAYGLRIEFNPTVDVSSKAQIGLEVLNDSAANGITQGLRVAGKFTTPMVVYSDAGGTTSIFAMDASGNLTTKNITSGTIGATGQIQATTSSDGASLLRFNTDRPWRFLQGGTAGSTLLRLSPEAVGKVFRITGPAGTTIQLEVTADDTAASGRVSIGTTAGGQIGFFGATTITQPNTTGTATGFVAGAGTTVTHLSTFTGNTGSTAYTIGDIVNALKRLGLVAS